MGGSGRVEQMMIFSLPLLSCESSVSVKENPNRKNIYIKSCRNGKNKYRAKKMCAREQPLKDVLNNTVFLVNHNELLKMRTKFSNKVSAPSC